MLVLSRKLLQKIYLSNGVILTVTDIDRGKIKIGIHAPKNVDVFREELLADEVKRRIEYVATDGRGM